VLAIDRQKFALESSGTIPGPPPRHAGFRARGAWPMVIQETAGWNGGRDRDRTCDPVDVNEVLSLVSPSARPKNRRKPATYAAFDFVESYAIDLKTNVSGTRLGRTFRLKDSLGEPRETQSRLFLG
jgi:hypothetical protein